MTIYSVPSKHIDLRGTPCPVNFIRCSLVLETLEPLDLLHVDIDRGEPEEMVISGLRKAGHYVQIKEKNSNWIRLMVICGVR